MLRNIMEDEDNKKRNTKMHKEKDIILVIIERKLKYLYK